MKKRSGNLIHPLEWDSNFFGFSVGKLLYAHHSCEDLNQLLSSADLPTLLYLFSNENISDCLPELAAIDEKLVFAHTLTAASANFELPQGIYIYNAAIDSYDQLLALALLSGTHSRFRVDERIGTVHYRRLYTRWLDRSIEESGTLVLLARRAQDVAGFVTVDLPARPHLEAKIGLLAVSPDYQRQGIAKALLEAAVHSAGAANQATLSVATQAVNIAAANLYTRYGFELVSRTWIYHLWNN